MSTPLIYSEQQWCSTSLNMPIEYNSVVATLPDKSAAITITGYIQHAYSLIAVSTIEVLPYALLKQTTLVQ
jgi:hypothetical protein